MGLRGAALRDLTPSARGLTFSMLYRPLGRAGQFVAEICLGAMTFHGGGFCAVVDGSTWNG
jgi:hypothetical protein